MSTAVPSFPSQATPEARGQRGDPAPAPANLKDGARIEAPKPPARQLEPAPAAPLAPARDDDLPRPGEVVDGFWWTPKWAQPLVKYRWVLVVLWLGMHVAAFNGQWRIGADSATFRSVARSLAAGEGYAILGEPQTQVYPGLPFLLAGLERLFGPAAWPGVLVTLAASAGVLWFTYHLIRRIAPAWVATVVTAGVGFNEFFVSLSHELMTDIPFLLGVVMALWGWETLTDPGLARRLRSGLCLAAGLALAASMRPTFWVLALALGAVCVGGLLVGLFPRFAPRAWTSGRDQARSWRFYATCLSVVFVVGLLFAVVDPRTRTLDLLEGGYESEVAERVLRVEDRIRETPDKLWEMLEDHLEALFFAERVEFLNLLLVATLLVGVVLVARRRPLWGGLVGVLLVVVFFASSTPRYYMMVLPVLWLGWATVMMSASRLFRRDWPRGAFLLATLGGVLLCNVAHDAKFVVEQRGTPFIESYKDGLYVPVVAMAQTLREHTAPGDVIIGPFGPEMTYLSHRRVLGRRHILTGYESSSRDQALAVEATGADWMVFPTDVYGHKDSPIDRLGREGILVPTNEDDSTVISAGEFDGRKWYFTTWAVDHTMLPGPGQAD